MNDSLPALYGDAAVCRACELGTTRNCVVISDGPTTPDFLFVGQSPGVEEDKDGRPFIGPSGHLLRETLKKVGIIERSTFINTTNCYPGPEKFKPEQAFACHPFFLRKLRMFWPNKVVIAVGDDAADALTASCRIVLNRIQAPEPLVAGANFHKIWHPSYILRSRSHEPEWIRTIEVLA